MKNSYVGDNKRTDDMNVCVDTTGVIDVIEYERVD